MLDPDDWQREIADAHLWVQMERRSRGLGLWKFVDGVNAMGDERCQMCKDAGFPDVLAHYKAVAAGRSHDGKAQPPLCWDHKNGKVPKRMQPAVTITMCAQCNKQEGKFISYGKLVCGDCVSPAEVEQPQPGFDKSRALALRAEGKTWKQVADELGVKMHVVYSECRKEDVQVKPRPKWEDCLKQIAPIAIGESKMVAYPKGGTRSQMNSIIGQNHITWKWRYSLKDNGDGTVTATKLGLWSEVDGGAIVKQEHKIELSQKETVTTTVETLAHTLGRRVTVYIPKAQPVTQIKLTPELAEAIWKSLTLEKKAELMDVEGMWRDFDDWTRMCVVNKVLLVDTEDNSGA